MIVDVRVDQRPTSGSSVTDVHYWSWRTNDGRGGEWSSVPSFAIVVRRRTRALFKFLLMKLLLHFLRLYSCRNFNFHIYEFVIIMLDYYCAVGCPSDVAVQQNVLVTWQEVFLRCHSARLLECPSYCAYSKHYLNPYTYNFRDILHPSQKYRLVLSFWTIL